MKICCEIVKTRHSCWLHELLCFWSPFPCTVTFSLYYQPVSVWDPWQKCPSMDFLSITFSPLYLYPKDHESPSCKSTWSCNEWDEFLMCHFLLLLLSDWKYAEWFLYSTHSRLPSLCEFYRNLSAHKQR